MHPHLQPRVRYPFVRRYIRSKYIIIIGSSPSIHPSPAKWGVRLYGRGHEWHWHCAVQCTHILCIVNVILSSVSLITANDTGSWCGRWVRPQSRSGLEGGREGWNAIRDQIRESQLGKNACTCGITASHISKAPSSCIFGRSIV